MKQAKPRRISYLAFFLACGLLVYFFFLGQSAINEKREELLKEQSQYQALLNQTRKENKEVRLEVQMAGTDAYLENMARTQYGYLKPGEIRFEILNPEVLFADEGLPALEP